MAKNDKTLSEKEITKKIQELKIELLRNPTKRGRVKKEIARLLTMAKNSKIEKITETKTEGKK